MSTASISRSPPSFEPAPPIRRSSAEKTEQAFTLPPEPSPAQGPRLRLDDDRAVSGRDRTERAAEPKHSQMREAAGDRTEAADRTEEADAAAETKAGTGEETAAQSEAGEEAQTEKAGAGEGGKDDSGKTDGGKTDGGKTDGGETDGGETDGGETDSDKAESGKSETREAGAGEQPAPATVEERKARLAAALAGAPIIGQGTPETAAAAGAAMQPAVPAEIGAEFLALAALAVQGGAPAKPETAAGRDGEAVAATDEAAATTQTAANAVLPPVPPAAPARADGQVSAGGEAAAAELRAGLKAQLPAALAVEAGKAVEAKPEDGKAAEATAVAATETKAAEQPGATGQATQTKDAAPAAPVTQQAAPLTPQAILAAGPQTLTKPEAPLTELDAAAQATAQAQAEAAAKATSAESTRPTPLHIVPIEIGARALAGNKRFDIRLDPAELGRVDVSLEISDKGDVSAKLTVDRVETLQLLQRDARTLERAFEQAGLKPTEGGIEMSLRDPADQSGSRQGRQDEEGSRTRRAWVETTEESALVAETAPLHRAARLGGVDLSI